MTEKYNSNINSDLRFEYLDNISNANSSNFKVFTIEKQLIASESIIITSISYSEIENFDVSKNHIVSLKSTFDNECIYTPVFGTNALNIYGYKKVQV